jgi:hypothetical protein
MTNAKGPSRHPFLEDLADDVILTTNTLNEKVEGKVSVLEVVGTAGKIYISQTTTYLNKISDGRTLLEYDAEIVGGRTVHAVVIVDWNLAGKVSHLNIGFSPLGGALSFATQLGALLPDGKRYGGL